MYRFTIEHLEDSKGGAVESNPFIFETRLHENIFRIVEMMKGKMELDEDDTTSFAVGLKLFGEVMLKNQDNELFTQFKPHFTNFMKELKRS
ncbi:hypothetical protein Dvar_33800 [Desulfosarcina variabilis str. Montpellier]|uniref:DUF3861 domain-containing protein n=1 Tax=Desulfosarcina variabilis TaxID=2300 RepID=UPI003AFB3DD0